MRDGRLAGLLAALLSPFALVCVWCVRGAIRRWREVAEVQRMLGGMDESERADFDEAVSRGAMYRDFERHAYEETCNLLNQKEAQ